MKTISYTSLARYAHCACRDCMNIVVDGDGRRTYCDDCLFSSCEGDGECSAPNAYSSQDADELSVWVNCT